MDISYIDKMKKPVVRKNLAAGFFYVILHENHIKM